MKYGGPTNATRSCKPFVFVRENQIPLEQATADNETEATFTEQPNAQVVVHSEWPSRVANQTIVLRGRHKLYETLIMAF